jgi:hypothetical protein
MRSQTAIVTEGGAHMFGKHHTLKQLSTGIAVAASLAVVAVPSALGAQDTWYRNAVSQAASRPSVTFITDTLGGNGQVTGSAKATPDALTRFVANHAGPATQAQGYRFITDTLGGNGRATQVSRYNPQAYVYGGASPALSKAIQDLGYGRTASPPVAASTNSSNFSWGAAGVGGGMVAAGLLLLLLCGTLLRTNRRGAVTT